MKKYPIDIDSVKKNQEDLENLINDENMMFSDKDREKLRILLDEEKKSLLALEDFYKQNSNISSSNI